ncbi:hypothetical protein [Streptosporangium sp. NPDC006007]|uniref:hypothetical protein n=1 Tax=Streptosporangium sp. NPDC006007 TaxID=3154575 RepID=UPI0033B7717C
MVIVQQLKDINTDAGQFVAGLLSDDISHEDQLTFALRLVLAFPPGCGHPVSCSQCRHPSKLIFVHGRR